ncbi:MAG: hypothetical protein H6991_12725 [Pseudomonadales bacterium]|nr:hypothetical protein [Pseudomonadales bacterium]
MRLICYSFLAWPLLACSLQDPNLEELRRLCEKDAGVNIYRSVDADGYYNGSVPETSFLELIKSDFEFIEFCDDNPLQNELLEGPGCGRMTRAPKSSGRCHPWLQKILDESYPEPYVRFRQDYCVQFESIPVATARYSFQTDLKAWQPKGGEGEFTRVRAWITDTNYSELMGEYISYSFNPNPGSSASRSCYHLDSKYSSYRDANFVNRILVQSGN